MCGEWAGNLETLALICDLIAEYQSFSYFPWDVFCAESCSLVAWFTSNQDEFFAASCTGDSGTIPPPCIDCDC